MAVVPLKTVSPSASQRNISSLDGLMVRLKNADLLGIPIDIEAIAEFLGLEVSEEIMDNDISGYLEFKNGVWVIGVNSLHHVNRRRFTVAHEIAHFVLHRDPNVDFVDKTFARRHEDANPMEREADDFAAKLLMPAHSIRNAIAEGCTSLQDLAGFFEVSALALKYRVQALGFSVK